MPLPNSYTEPTFKVYLIAVLSNVATVLGWTTSTPEVEEAVTDTELALGVADIVAATDIAAVRVLGERAILRRAQTALAPLYDLVEEQQQFRRSQAFQAVSKRLAAVETQALRYDTAGYAVGVGQRTYPGDPYSYLPDEARTA
jgi:hypothetical protein